MFCDFEGKTVLITGGTRGIGLACGLAFGRLGAECVLTYRWGSASEDEVRARFAELGASTPVLIQADISSSDDTDDLMARLKDRGTPVDAFISNATGAVAVKEQEDLTERAFKSSLLYGAWPTIAYLQKLNATFDRYPRYVVAISTTGIDSYTRNYDLVAASKAALEALCRYQSFRLRKHDCRINLLRTRAVLTESMLDVVGDGLADMANRAGARGHLISPEDVANTVVALCSGYMDDVNGQTLTVDRGGLFCDNVARLYVERETLGL